MALWHHEELEDSINQAGWRIIGRFEESDEKGISGSWVIQREKELKINFDGLDDLVTLSMEESYACNIENNGPSLYFYKKGEQWKLKLEVFVNALNNV
ncbi:MAG: hypothetical protein ACI8ZM_004582 [Crocinitomix sp.]|jgi:hypothetical protein